MTKEKIVDKVHKLLRLAQSPNEHEAALAAAMAQNLIDRYKLGVLPLEEEAERPHEDLEFWDDPVIHGLRVPSWKSRLLSVLARANNGSAIKCDDGMRLVARVSDAELIRTLYWWCEQEILRLSHAQRGNGIIWQNNYRIGCTEGINDQLKAQHAKMLAEVKAEAVQAGSVALVKLDTALARTHSEETELAQYIKAHFVMGSGSSGGRYDRSARSVGREHGRNINLSVRSSKRIGSGN